MNMMSYNSAAWTDVTPSATTLVPASSLGVESSWFKQLTQRARRLIRLEPNWDSYGAPAIQPQSVMAALELTKYLLSTGHGPAESRIPDLIPTPDGTVQVEWHAGEFFLEVEAISRTRYEVFSHLPEQDDQEFTLDVDFSELNRCFKALYLIVDNAPSE